MMAIAGEMAQARRARPADAKGGEAVRDAENEEGASGAQVRDGVISSLVVETAPECTAAVAKALPEMAGVEVHEVAGHNVVITIEAETVDDSYDISTAIAGLAGVVNVSLIYVNFEGDRTIYPDGV